MNHLHMWNVCNYKHRIGEGTIILMRYKPSMVTQEQSYKKVHVKWNSPIFITQQHDLQMC